MMTQSVSLSEPASQSGTEMSVIPFVLAMDQMRVKFQNISARHVISAIARPQEMASQLNKLRRIEIYNFFIFARNSTIQNVLDAARSRFLGPDFAWHLIPSDGTSNNLNWILVSKFIIFGKSQLIATTFYENIIRRTLAAIK